MRIQVKTELYDLIFNKNVSLKYKDTTITKILNKNYIKIKDGSKYCSDFKGSFEVLSLNHNLFELKIKIRKYNDFYYIEEKIFKYGKKYTECFLYDQNLEFKSYNKIIPAKHEKSDENKRTPRTIEIKNNNLLYGFYKKEKKRSDSSYIYLDIEMLKNLGVNIDNKFNIVLNDDQLLILEALKI